MLEKAAFIGALAIVMSVFGPKPVTLQERAADPSKKTTLHLVRTLKIVPGKQLEFLLWLKKIRAAENDRFYAHVEGADWDWVTVTPLPDPARYSTFRDSRATIDYRGFVAFHEDTFAHGPFTLDELIAAYQRETP